MWSDIESSRDYLNFGEVSELTVEILESKDMLPTSIGIFGNWGAGKSSLLKLIENQLKNNNDHIIINFDAWLYQGFDDSKAALLEVITNELIEQSKNNSTVIEKGEKLLKRINKLRLLGVFAESTALAFGVPTGGLVANTINSISNLKDGIQDETEYSNIIEQLQGLKTNLENIAEREKSPSPPKQIHEFRNDYSSLIEEINKPVVVIIDNLDRCLPENTIHTLEAIRLFLFLKNTAFIIAADEEMIKTSVANHFNDTSSRHQLDYLDKLIQIPIRIPKAGIREIRSYLFMLYAIDAKIEAEQLDKLNTLLEKDLRQSWKKNPISSEEILSTLSNQNKELLQEAFYRADRIAPILANSPTIHGNPRTIKRLLNVVKMRSKISIRREMQLDEAIITKLVILERCVDTDLIKEFYSAVDQENGKPEFIKNIETSNDYQNAPKSWQKNNIKNFIREWIQLEPPLADIDLRAAIYLARETIPIGHYANKLSPRATEAFDILLKVKNQSSASKTLQNTLSDLTPEDYTLIMEAIISRLKNNNDWSARPKGFAGALALAKKSENAKKLFYQYLKQLDKNFPWLNSTIESLESQP